MSDVDFGKWHGAVFMRSDGPEWRSILFVDGRAPVSVGLPVDDEWLEEFRLGSWCDDEPTYSSIGFSPRPGTLIADGTD